MVPAGEDITLGARHRTKSEAQQGERRAHFPLIFRDVTAKYS